MLWCTNVRVCVRSRRMASALEPGPLRVKSRLMFLPIITYADGYGFTYGGRVSTVDLLGLANDFPCR